MNQLKPPIWCPGIQTGHPLANGLVFAWPFWGDGQTYTDIVGGKKLTGYNTPTRTSSELGRAVLFDDAQSEYLQYAGALITAHPLTMACWFKTDNDVDNQILMSITDANVWRYWYLLAREGVSGNLINATTGGTVGTKTASSSLAFTANTWHHACAVFASSTDRRSFLDGGNKGTNAQDSGNPDGLDKTSIGAGEYANAVRYHMSGIIALPLIWNRALSDGEIAELYADPWGMFRQRERSYFWSAASGGAAGYVPYPLHRDMTGGLAA
ncbi:MAG: LamG domain-containing protein [Phycisphaerae bacterium]|nr:LamG domain-containing protein [Phycisphaerae bacterium]